MSLDNQISNTDHSIGRNVIRRLFHLSDVNVPRPHGRPDKWSVLSFYFSFEKLRVLVGSIPSLRPRTRSYFSNGKRMEKDR